MLGRGRREPTRGCDILVLVASYGAGHRQAARAVTEALLLREPGLQIASADYVDLVNPVFNRITQSAYVLSVRYIPAAFGWFYHSTSRIAPDSWFQRYLNSLGRQRVLGLVRARRPRVVLCTFPTQAGVLSELRRRGLVDVPIVTVVTDNTVHSQWIHSEIDRCCVSAAEVAAGVVSRGIPRERVVITGIPVRPVFAQRHERAATLGSLGLDPGRPTVLVMSGAFGMLRGVLGACRALLDLARPPQIILVTGRDRRLATEVQARLGGPDTPLRVLGFVDQIAPLMQAVDLLITKAGGITTAEAMATGLPMVIFRPIPGQEQMNTAFLVERGVAVTAEDAPGLAGVVQRLLDEPMAREAMRRACLELGRPRAASDVADVVLATMRDAAAAPVA